MQIQFKGTNYELDSALTALAEKKIRTLEKYMGKVGGEPIVYADLGKHTEAHQNGAIWYADCTITTEGKRYYAQATAENLRTAIDRMVKELDAELRKDHKKQHSLAKRTGFRIKEFFRFST
jgi:ribosomal subunit interface protein